MKNSETQTFHAGLRPSYALVGGAPEAYGSQFVCVYVVCVSVQRTSTKQQSARR